jgi:hypothetical protein
MQTVRMKFRTTIIQSGKNTTGIEVSPEIVEALGKGKRPPVRVTINDYTYRTSVASMGGVYMFSVSAEVRDKAGVAGGDEVEVELELDTEPREVEVPDDFATALAANKAAKERFAALSYSNKRRWVLSIEDAKTEATRQRRIAKAVADISAGK